MTEQQIIETLATKIMGWEVVIINVCGNEVTHYGKNTNWNPLKNIADAWQVAEKFSFHRVEGQWKTGYSCILAYVIDWDDDSEMVKGKGSTAQEAICQAALKTVA